MKRRAHAAGHEPFGRRRRNHEGCNHSRVSHVHRSGDDWEQRSSPSSPSCSSIPPRLFGRGELVLAPVVPVWLIALAALGALALVVVAYRQLRGISRIDRVVLGATRALALVIVLACLLRPTEVLSSAVPQRNVLAILLDDSRSMRVADVDGGRPTPRRCSAPSPTRARWCAGSRRATRCGPSDSPPSPPPPRRRRGSTRAAGAPISPPRSTACAPDLAGLPRGRRDRRERRRRQRGRRPRRVDPRAQGAPRPGLHGGRRPGAVQPRSLGHERLGAAERARRVHRADRRGDRRARRGRGEDDADGRGGRQDRRDARRSRSRGAATSCARGCACRRCPPAATGSPCARGRSAASSSRRTTNTARCSTCGRDRRGCCTSRASRGPSSPSCAAPSRRTARCRSSA